MEQPPYQRHLRARHPEPPHRPIGDEGPLHGVQGPDDSECLFQYAVRERMRARNPVQAVPMPSGEQADDGPDEVNAFTDAELAQTLATQTEVNPGMAEVTEFLISRGCAGRSCARLGFTTFRTCPSLHFALHARSRMDTPRRGRRRGSLVAFHSRPGLTNWREIGQVNALRPSTCSFRKRVGSCVGFVSALREMDRDFLWIHHRRPASLRRIQLAARRHPRAPGRTVARAQQRVHDVAGLRARVGRRAGNGGDQAP